MTALAADRDTPLRKAQDFFYSMADNVKIYAGSLVVLDTAGNAKPGVSGTGLVAVGRAKTTIDNTITGHAAGLFSIGVETGCFQFANGDGITKANIGDTAYVLDDQTVTAGNTSQSPCGVIADLDANGVWVNVFTQTELASTGLLAANNLSDVGTAATSAHNLGLGTADSPTFSGLTLTGAETGTSAAFSGAVTGTRPVSTQTIAHTVDVPANEGNAVYLDLTDGAVITLPKAAAGNKGQEVTLVNTAANGAALVSFAPNASDAIFGGAMAVRSGGVVNKAFNNTKATALKGDYCTLVSDGSTGWYIIGAMGVWASTP